MRRKLINDALLFWAIATSLVTFSADFKIRNKSKVSFDVVFVTGGEATAPQPMTQEKGLFEIPEKLYLLPKTQKATWTEFTFSQPKGKNVHVSIEGIKGGSPKVFPQKGVRNNLVASNIKMKVNTPPPAPPSKKELEELKRKEEEEKKRKELEERKRKEEEKKKRKEEESKPTPPPLPPRDKPTPPPLPPRDKEPTPPPPPMPESLLKDIQEAKKPLKKIEDEAKKLSPENIPASTEARDSLLEQIRQGKKLKKVEEEEKKELLTPKELEELEKKYKEIAKKSLDKLNDEWDQLTQELVKLKLGIASKEQTARKPSQEEFKKVETIEASLKIIDKLADQYMPKTEDDEWED